MKTQKTYTFEAGNCGYYRWKPRIDVHDANGYVTTYHPTEASYKRFVALANSGQYDVRIVVEESVGWTLARKPQLSFVMQLDWTQRQQA